MKTLSRILFLAATTNISSACFAQSEWDGSAPPVNTYTTNGNLGVGVGPATDARVKIYNIFNHFTNHPSHLLPGLKIQRELQFPIMNGPIANIMEVWKQDVSFTIPPTVGPNQLKFIIDGEGQVGLNKQPSKALDVANDANIDGIMDIGNVAGSSSSTDALVVHGNITFTRPLDGQYRNFRARTSAGALAFLANTAGEDGPAIVMNGIANTTSGVPGGIVFSTVSTGRAPAFDFNNFDPSGAGSWKTRMRITADGRVVIGDPSSIPLPGDYNLYVDNGILAKRIKVALPATIHWSDFVFNDDYNLKPLSEVETFIKVNKHLPEIPSAGEVGKEGIDLAQMDAKLLQKIEELTLYVIQQQKEINHLKSRLRGK